MSKKHTSAIKALLGLIFLVGLGLYLFRQPILDALLERQLTRRGVPFHSLTVEEVSLNGLILRDISLGAANELQTEKIHATWTFQGLIAGELETIEMSGLHLSLDLSGEKPPLGSLQKLFEDKGDSGNNKIPQVSLRDAKVDLYTRWGDIAISLDGTIEQGPSGKQLIAAIFETTAAQGHVAGDFDATLDSTGKLQGTLAVSTGALTLPDVKIAEFKGNGSFNLIRNLPQEISGEFDLFNISLTGAGLKDAAFEQARLSLLMDASDARIKGDLLAAGKVPALSFAVTLNDYLQQPEFVAEVTAEISALRSAWDFLSIPQPGSGSATLTLQANGQMPALHATDNNRLRNSTLQGKGDILLKALGFARKVSDLNGNIAFSADFADGVGKVTLAQGSKLEASGLDLDWVKRLGFPTHLITVLKPDTQLSITGKGENAVRVNVDNHEGRTQFNVTTGLAVEADKAQLDINALAEATINEQNQLTAFKVSDIAITSSDIDYAGGTLDHLDLTGNIQGSREAWEGELDLATEVKRFRFGPYDARQTKAELPLRLIFDAHAWRLSLRKQGSIRLGRLASDDSIHIQEPLDFRLSSANVELTPNVSGVAIKHQISVRLNNFTLRASRADAPALEMNIRPGKIVHTGEMSGDKRYNGKSVISAAGITLPQYQLQLEKISSTIHLGAASKGATADFKIAQIRHLAPAPHFAPLGLSGNARLRRSQISVDASGGAADAQIIKLTAEHALDSGTGRLTLAIGPLAFSPDALQPSAVLPGLAVLEGVSGKADASSRFIWSDKGVSSDGVFDLQNWSFVLNGVTIDGLSARLELTDLLSPNSPARQQITVRRIDPGVPIEDVAVTYQIQATDAPRIAIEKVRLAMLDGTLSTGPTLIDPSSSHTSMDIKVTNIDLETLFSLIGVEGLAGEGRLDGRIPLTFEDGLVSIEDGVLAANMPGVLRLKSKKISELLAGRAENVDLLLQALTEFHYSELILKLNNSANNELAATLSLLGNNPAVLKGRLFRLNINLESNIGKILNAVAQGYGLSNTALRRALRLR